MQKKWIKEKQKEDRAAQKKVKAARLAKLRDTQPSGFRKIHLGTDVYLWRYFGTKVEIRTPHDKKWIVPIWIIQGLPDEKTWEKEHEDDDGDFGYAYAVSPGAVRDYIVVMVKLC
jgi:phage terminase large subunit GpA-like protein